MHHTIFRRRVILKSLRPKILFSIWLCSFRLSLVCPLFESYPTATSIAGSVFKIILEKPKIDPVSKAGIQLDRYSVGMQFNEVHFNYPSRPEIPILRKLTFTANPGEMIAFVGTSGGGKTTILQLLQRFYDPNLGSITVDTLDLKNVNVNWWRSCIGFVGQEAQLFTGTIAENIRLGKLSATVTEIENAAKQANAHNFIMQLEKGYSTMIGYGGGTLSGGEKQRIAIARALIRDPKIFLLDEPTSALDAESEAIVQAAINSASKGRTTFLVTHRLKTVRTVDKIIVLNNGEIVEEGTHEQLIKSKSYYYSMVESEKELADGYSQHITVKHDEHDDKNPSHSPRETTEYTEEDEQVRDVSLRTIISWIRPEMPYIILAILITTICGCFLPAVSVNYGEMIGALSEPSDEERLKKTDFGSYVTLGISLLSLVMTFTQYVIYTMIGHSLITRLRCLGFSSVMNQEVGWFDKPQNHPARICSRLAHDTFSIHAMTGIGLYNFLQSTTTLVVALVLSLYYSWKLALITAIGIPIVYIGVFADSYMLYKDNLEEQEGFEGASKVALEAINHKRLVTALGLETYFIKKYKESLSISGSQIGKKSIVRGLGFCLGETAPFLGYCISLGYGAYLIQKEDLHYQNIVKISELIIFGTWMLAQSSVLTPSFSMALFAAKRMQYIFERVPKIVGGSQYRLSENFTGDKIRFNHVAMSYPTRPESMVLKDLTMSIENGQNVAVVGKSGGGKSSILLLLQRIYSPSSGQIYLNGTNITHLSLHSLRHQLGLVSQEPVLLSGTIRSNIEYGDNTRTVTMEEIMEAAKAAHIHKFISSLPEGYDTPLGSKAIQLSGGQKQRIAIARALVKNPSVLLLDEATSALDPESESLVQNTLNSVAKGRTTITIAHRLGAVINADVIYVVDGGKIIEQGTHEQLLAKGGLYHKMHGGKK